MRKGSRDPGKPYYPVGSRVPRTYLLTYLLTYFLSYLEREREKRNGWFEPRANILPYTFSSKIFTKDESRPGKSLLGDARILRVSTENIRNGLANRKIPPTKAARRALSKNRVPPLPRSFGSVPPSLSFPCRLSTC